MLVGVFGQWPYVNPAQFIVDLSFTGQQVMTFVGICFHIIEVFVKKNSNVSLSTFANQQY